MTGFRWLARLTRPWRPEKDHLASAKAQVDARAVAAAGNAARDAGHWEEAASHYALALALRPDDAPIQVQLGHVLKELGRIHEAEMAYRTAAHLAPKDSDPLIQLGHALKLQGRLDEAIESYAHAVRIDPASVGARSELIASGGRNRLPDHLYGRSAATEALTRLSATLGEGVERLKDLAVASTFPVEAFDAFRRTFPVRPAPQSSSLILPVHVLIEARHTTPADLRTTLISLIDQGFHDWTATVVAPARMLDDPVASLAKQDDRLAFSTQQWPAERVDAAASLLLCDAGTCFDPEALNWFATAKGLSGAAAIYADHDHHHRHWRRGSIHAFPALQPMPDRFDLATTPAPPAALMIDGGLWPLLSEVSEYPGPEQRREILLRILASGDRVAHLPRLLSSVRLGEGQEPQPAVRSSNTQFSRAVSSTPAILVIIPTRDEPAMLGACIDSLRDKAADGKGIDILVIDNRSRLAETADLLAARACAGDIRTQAFDEPFNWARINNIAARDSDDKIVVFANNDVEMLTDGWDDILREIMADKTVGIVGARLLYPDNTIQHAGAVLGANDRRPVHEGLGEPALAPGPLGRWRRRRQAAAVTGAFMAVNQGVFKQLSGFDERLAVGYNDMDFCLRARGAGLAVLYDPAIELVHHESKTRGRNDDGAKTDWDDGELADLHRRWGEWLFFDPGKNPHWLSAESRPFDGLRDLPTSEVTQHLLLSARLAPWSIAPSLPGEVEAQSWTWGNIL